MADEFNQMSRRRARSGQVSAATDKVVIRSGPNTYFEVHPRWIPRTAGDELSLKMLYWKKIERQFRAGFPAEFTLSHEESRKLADVIYDCLAIASRREDGDFLIVRLDGDDAQLAGESATTAAKVVTGLLRQNDILQVLQDDPDGKRLLAGLNTSSRLIELEAAVAELEHNLDNNVSDEATYQKWCEQHSWAFGNAYVMRDEVRIIAPGDQVDLLMQRTANGLRDIFELKRPNHEPIKWDATHQNWYWSSEAAKAIGQCHRYLDSLHDGAALPRLRDHPEVVGYHPQAVIVLGRSRDWPLPQLQQLHGLNARLHSVRLITYDQLLAQARQVLTTLRAEHADEQ